MNTPFDQLTDSIRQLPGIGPRQARRIAYFIVRKDKSWVHSLSETLRQARAEVAECMWCRRLFPTAYAAPACTVCTDSSRDAHTLLVVEKDVDLENVEKTGVYTGRYFVLGGTVSLLDKEPEKKVRIRSLEQLIFNKDRDVREIILALSATTEGEDTAVFLKERLTPLLQNHPLTLRVLGRGLSTGTELEYVDADTMQSALKGRT
jgi:recombination protein RecR